MSIDKPIISTWGIGPSYRRRVKENILEAIRSGYEHTMDYAILTDVPEDFDEIAKETGKIKLITNIHEVRKDYEWSIEKEHIPTAIDYENYANQYIENHKKSNHFSYALHRFALPDLAKNGYTRILFMDSDMKVNYDKIGIEFSEEEFWREFDTPKNSVKGCVAEGIGFYNPNNDGQFVWKPSRTMGGCISTMALQACSITLYLLEEKFKQNRFVLPLNYDMTEGPFRYYHFDTPNKVKEYFELWEESQRIIMSKPALLETLSCGGYMYCDYIPVSSANIYAGLEVENFSNVIYDIQIHYEDRYFLPKGFDAKFHLPVKPAKNIDEFFEINKDTEKECKEKGFWPFSDPQYIYTLKEVKKTIK